MACVRGKHGISASDFPAIVHTSKPIPKGTSTLPSWAAFWIISESWAAWFPRVLSEMRKAPPGRPQRRWGRRLLGRKSNRGAPVKTKWPTSRPEVVPQAAAAWLAGWNNCKWERDYSSPVRECASFYSCFRHRRGSVFNFNAKVVLTTPDGWTCTEGNKSLESGRFILKILRARRYLIH